MASHYEGVGSFLHRQVQELEDRLLVRVEVNEIGKEAFFSIKTRLPNNTAP